MKQMKKQQGFTIVVVLLLSMMASVVVISSLKDTTMQERLSGNFEKQTNARLAAESGLFSTHSHLEAELAKVPTTTLTQLIASKGEGGKFTYAATNKLEGMLANIELLQTSDGLLSVASGGERFEGEKQLRALYELVPGEKGKSPFEQVLVGCNGVTVGAGGAIKSYHSKTNETGIKADIGTIYQAAPINLSGSAPIWGSVLATGTITVSGSAFIAGDLHSNNDVKVTGGGGGLTPPELKLPSGTRVGGNVIAGRNLSFRGGVNGTIKVKANIEDLGNSGTTFITNAESDGLALMYGGSWNSKPNQWNSPKDIDGTLLIESKFNVSPTIVAIPAYDPTKPPVDSKDPSLNCDPLDVKAGFDALISNKYVESLKVGGKQVLEISNAFAKYSGVISENPKTVLGELERFNPIKSEIFGETKKIFFFKNLEIDGGQLIFTKESYDLDKGADNETPVDDISVFVAGDFTYSTSGSSLINIKPGVSVTFYVQGKIKIQKPIESEGKEGVKANGKPQLSFYSSYEGKVSEPLNCKEVNKRGNSGAWGVELVSTAAMYASIYAPLTDALVGASGILKGAVRGNSITTCGDGDIVYDEALGELSSGGTIGGSTPKLVFKGWRYHAEADQLATSSTR
ncbi:pilus assembly PilX N-terminal domain-containing protein [Pseudoalteromonas tunicata]|uniref:pilus assembly PilX family protein n=2 Tax=Pseudoalteromonas tunicata TaxID=314281 RepID=UPI00273F8712|nr:pilus assembly PilX N-terminal domain-containing protein [Pseudoalteromonas tunicata]MDP5211735.1 pilus assembly PilX N-terminal domain-containing protein [Pseudoalteromonas tunicata]